MDAAFFSITIPAPEAHWRLSVCTGTSVGKPARNMAMRHCTLELRAKAAALWAWRWPRHYTSCPILATCTCADASHALPARLRVPTPSHLLGSLGGGAQHAAKAHVTHSLRQVPGRRAGTVAGRLFLCFAALLQGQGGPRKGEGQRAQLNRTAPTSGSIPVRRSVSCSTAQTSSEGWVSLRPPRLALHSAVRQADTITTSSSAGLRRSYAAPAAGLLWEAGCAASGTGVRSAAAEA